MKYHTQYMRKYRKNPVNREKERERDREYKKMKRRTDPDWLARERARRRGYGKYRTERNKKKHAKNHRDYANKNRIKESARAYVCRAIKNGEIKRKQRCDLCGKLPIRIGKERQLLRADHYRGYERKYWLVIRWICIPCDGKLNRSKKKLVSP